MAYIVEPCVRETSTITGTSDIVLGGAMYRSLKFSDVMANGDTCDYVISYANAFEEGIGTYVSSTNTLQRTTVTRALQANGTVNTTKISFAAGVKTVIMISGSPRLKDLKAVEAKAARVDVAQTFTGPELAQLQSNLGIVQSGTAALFMQTSAPTGWTKDTTHNDKALRVVSGTASSGGTNNFSTSFGSSFASDATTITTTTMPSHTHTGTTGGDSVDHTHTDFYASSSASTAGVSGVLVPQYGGSATSGISTNHTHAFTSDATGSGSSHTHGVSLNVKYVDVIVAIKN